MSISYLRYVLYFAFLFVTLRKFILQEQKKKEKLERKKESSKLTMVIHSKLKYLTYVTLNIEEILLCFFFLIVLNLLRRHWLITLHRFQVYNSIIPSPLYCVVCSPKSSFLLLIFIPPLPSPISA